MMVLLVHSKHTVVVKMCIPNFGAFACTCIWNWVNVNPALSMGVAPSQHSWASSPVSDASCVVLHCEKNRVQAWGCLVTNKGAVISDKHSSGLSLVKHLVTSRHIVSF